MKKAINNKSKICLNFTVMIVAIFLLNGCGVRGVNRITPAFVAPHGTYYSKSLACVGALLPQENTYKYITMVASFLDKTGKGSITTSKPITQGAADLAADSLAKLKYFKIKTAIPHNFRDNPQIFEFNKTGTDFFIHGSIVTLESTQDQRDFNFSLDPIDISHKVTRVLAIVHMSINSSLDNTVFVNDRGEMASGNFKAEWDIFENNVGFFRILGDKAVVLNGAIKISQVADQALHEAIELGLIELVGRMFQIPYGRCIPKVAGDFCEIDKIIKARHLDKSEMTDEEYYEREQPQEAKEEPKKAHHKTKKHSQTGSQKQPQQQEQKTIVVDENEVMPWTSDEKPAAKPEKKPATKPEKPAKKMPKEKPQEIATPQMPEVAAAIGEVKATESTAPETKQIETPAPAIETKAPEIDPNHIPVAKSISQDEVKHKPKNKPKAKKKVAKEKEADKAPETQPVANPDAKPSEEPTKAADVNSNPEPATTETENKKEGEPLTSTPTEGTDEVKTVVVRPIMLASVRPDQAALNTITSDAEPADLTFLEQATASSDKKIATKSMPVRSADVASISDKLMPLGRDDAPSKSKPDSEIITKTIFKTKEAATKEETAGPKLAPGEIAYKKVPVAKPTAEKPKDEAKVATTTTEPINQPEDAAAMDAKQLTPMQHNMNEPAAAPAPAKTETAEVVKPETPAVVKKVPVAKKTTKVPVAKPTVEPEVTKEIPQENEPTAEADKEKPAPAEEQKAKPKVAKETNKPASSKDTAKTKDEPQPVAKSTTKLKPEPVTSDAPLSSLQDDKGTLTPLTCGNENLPSVKCNN